MTWSRVTGCTSPFQSFPLHAKESNCLWGDLRAACCSATVCPRGWPSPTAISTGLIRQNAREFPTRPHGGCAQALSDRTFRCAHVAWPPEVCNRLGESPWTPLHGGHVSLGKAYVVLGGILCPASGRRREHWTCTTWLCPQICHLAAASLLASHWTIPSLGSLS